MRGSTSVGMIVAESVLMAPGTTRAYGAGATRSNRLTRDPSKIVTESSTRRKPGIESRVWLPADRKSTRLNSSHLVISYAVFCLKKKKRKETQKDYIQNTCSYRI